MTPERDAPFLNFVLAIAHSGLSTGDFIGDTSEEDILNKWGITKEQLAAVRAGNLPEVQRYVQDEVGSESPVVATIWVGHVPWPWVGTS